VQVLDEERELRELLEERGYLRCRNVPVSILDLKWRSFDDYLASLPRKHRVEFQRQIKRSREAGNDTETVGSCAGIENRLLELLDANARKYGGRPFAAGKDFFGSLTGNLGPAARIFALRNAGRLTAACVVIVEPPAGVALAVGVEEAGAGEYAYFQVTYYSTIADAIACGLERLYFGREMYQVKLRRGCRLTNAWIYMNPAGVRRVVAASWFAIASRWNRRKLPVEARRVLR
ncbi:MAG: GNAT family N-acetyltransferase, partial [Bryobacteraceae bacterium]